MTLRKAVVFGVLATGLLAAGSVAAEDVIAARQANFKVAKEAMGLIKKTLEDGGDLAVVKAQAVRLTEVAQKAGPLFPAGSDKGDTKAKADIWKNLPDFQTKGQAYGAEAAKLVEVAASGDAGAVKKQFGAVGASCKSCHESYKAE
ncbi:MAG TPA: cytochrome c [Azospirillaceae bacterium]|nr:cytochrome c [Azospirillaceae bacterium]